MFHFSWLWYATVFNIILFFTKYQIKDSLPSNTLESLSNDDGDPDDNA